MYCLKCMKMYQLYLFFTILLSHVGQAGQFAVQKLATPRFKKQTTTLNHLNTL